MAKSHLIAAALAALLSCAAYAGSNSQGPHGGIAAARGIAASRAANTASMAANANSNQSGQGGAYQASVVDNYQPWPESEMRQFQKPRWEPYAGE